MFELCPMGELVMEPRTASELAHELRSRKRGVKSLDRLYEEAAQMLERQAAEPGNCRWASVVVQNNNKSTNRRLTYNGVTQTLTQWACELGIRPENLAYRLAHWPYQDAMSRGRVDRMTAITLSRIGPNSHAGKK